jgi:hypothetical protein
MHECSGQTIISGSRARNRRTVPLVALVITAVFCAVAGLAGGYFFFKVPTPPTRLSTSTSHITATAIAEYTQPSSMKLPTQTPVILPTSTKQPSFTLEEWDSWNGDTPECVICSIENWSEQTKQPMHYYWDIDFPYGTPAEIYLAWCAIDQNTLTDNWANMGYELIIDGHAVNLDELSYLEKENSDRACNAYAGVLPNWGRGKHSYIWIHRVYQSIHDGWDRYDAGDYIFEFTVNVK